MGVTVKTIGTMPVDRNIARIEVFSEGEVRDDWRIVIHFQDAPYDGEKRLDEPRFGTERVEVSYGEIKDEPMPGGGYVRDLFIPIRGLGYALRQMRIDQAAERAKAEAAARG